MRHEPLLNIPLSPFRVAAILPDLQVSLRFPKCLFVGRSVKTCILLIASRVVVFKAEGTARFLEDSGNLH